MDFDDLFSSKPKDPLAELVKQDLGPLSLDELALRIATLKAEIERVEAHRDDAARHRSAADDLFKRESLFRADGTSLRAQTSLD